MLRSLFIQNILLIDRLEIDFSAGLSVLTGETGAGKSILLEALGLALGERGQASLVRPGASQATVSATFLLPHTHPIHELLAQQEITVAEELILRRVVTPEGNSKAYVNDQPVSIGFLKNLGKELIEIHGQFDQILYPVTHRRFLDHFGGYTDFLEAVSRAYRSYEKAKIAFEEAKKFSEEKKNQEDYLRYAVEEFSALNSQEGEEEKLLQKRSFLQNQSKIVETLHKAYQSVTKEGGLLDHLGQILTGLERLVPLCGPTVQPLLDTLTRAHVEIGEAKEHLNQWLRGQEEPHGSLEDIENRLYALRALARKHGCPVDALGATYQKLSQELNFLTQGTQTLEGLEKTFLEAKQNFLKKAETLHDARFKASGELVKALELELDPLKLGQASFKVDFQPLAEVEWTAEGSDKVEFMVKTNPGLPFGGLGKIASGGERSRFMLAFKVVLAQATQATVLVFDEIDSGVGGAVAAAIGERLAKLSRHQQVIAITHSPQVAAHANTHLFVQKYHHADKETLTRVIPLTASEKREEIARMLSADQVTSEARAAADTLLKRAQEVA